MEYVFAPDVLLRAGEIHSGWLPFFVEQGPLLARIGEWLSREVAAGGLVQPARENIFRVFRQDPADVRVLIVGQDPYPGLGVASGLAFSVDAAGSGRAGLPASLRNIFVELVADLGVPFPVGGDLDGWRRSGVFLLNRVLTVRPGVPKSHAGCGWEEFTLAAVMFLAARGFGGMPLVAVLWGGEAARLAPVLRERGVVVLVSAHPSPLSAWRGFFGSRPFSAVNRELVARGVAPVVWEL